MKLPQPKSSSFQEVLSRKGLSGYASILFFVSPDGAVDSLTLREVTPDFPAELLRPTLMTWSFWPAVDKGCAVPGRSVVLLAWPRSGPRSTDQAPAVTRDQGVIHLVSPGSTTNGPVAPALVARRIASAARQIQQYAPIPRAAFFDIAYPADTREYSRMAGHGLLLVTAISQSEEELPATPYLTTSGGDVPLRLVTSVVGSVQTDDSIVRRVFGKYRTDALYLIPLHPGARGSDLLVNFAKNRQGFKLGTIAASLPDYLRAVASTRATGAEPAESAMLNMIRREYPGFVSPQ